MTPSHVKYFAISERNNMDSYRFADNPEICEEFAKL